MDWSDKMVHLVSAYIRNADYLTPDVEERCVKKAEMMLDKIEQRQREKENDNTGKRYELESG